MWLYSPVDSPSVIVITQIANICVFTVARSGAPPGQYKTTLKDEKDRTPDRSTDGGGGGLKRSHSTPNIAKLIQDENAARNYRQIPIDRSAKPSPV